MTMPRDDKGKDTVLCQDCLEWFPRNFTRGYKYEPSIRLCDDCHDYRMADDDCEADNDQE